MKYILSFFLGIATLFLLAATSQTTGLLTVKPATPKIVAVKTAYGMYSNNDARDFILSKIKEGFILKNITRTGSGADIIIVMEKY